MRRAVLILVFIGLVASTAHASPATVTLLTLDDRPCNTLLVQQLAAIAGVNLTLTTDRSMAGRADLVSLNAATFGSLVASRSGDPTNLAPVKLSPGVLVHFAVPRAQPLVKDDASMAAYTAALTALGKNDVQFAMVAAIGGTGPEPTDAALQSYAHRLRGWFDYLARCDIPRDRLLVTLDDNRPGPLAAYLKLRLGEYSAHVQDGTDEGMMLLLARWLREHQTALPYEMGVVWTDPAALLTVQPFESGMPVENLLRMADWLHLRLTSKTDSLPAWRPLLWMHGPAEWSSVLEATATMHDHPVVIADFAALNKGDKQLFDAFGMIGVPPGIVGYVGWNTTSNTVGTAVALWAAIDYGYAERPDPETVRAAIELFLWARILDDYFYMAEVRPAAQTALRDAGEPTMNMTPELVARESEALQFQIMEAWNAHRQWANSPAYDRAFREIDPGGHTNFSVTLPWARMFEIGLIPYDLRRSLPTVHPAPVDPAPR